MKEFLNDKNFLNQLDDLHVKDLYVRLTILSWSEEPIKEIQGRVTSAGSLNLDGSSSLRRTGSLSIFAEEKDNDLENIDNELSINKKVRLELGVKNTVPDRKMEVLNGHNMETEIINYQEKYGDIVWFPLGIYVLFDPSISHDETGVVINISFKDKMCLLNGDVGGVIPAAVIFSESEYTDENGNLVIEYPTLYQIIMELVNHLGNEKLTNIIISDLPTTAKQAMKYIGFEDIYYVAIANGIKFFTDYNQAITAAGGDETQVQTYSSNEDIGFLMTDFTYPGELTCNPGDTITSVLDNIVTVLGNFEYFYDVEGLFHFQEVKNYLNTSYSTTILNELNNSPDYQVDFSLNESVYLFNGTKHISNINNNPVYSNVKNDFVVWGKRVTPEGLELPIRYHLAIDERPKMIGYDEQGAYYGIHDNIELYYDELNTLRARKIIDTAAAAGIILYTIYTRDYREELYYQGIEAEATGSSYNYYYTELSVEWPKLFNLQPRTGNINIAEGEKDDRQRFKQIYVKDPSQMDFYLDIIEPVSIVGQYSVKNIGRRSMVVQEDEINCIFEKEIPDLVFIDVSNTTSEERARLIEMYNAKGQAWYQIDSAFMSLLSAGGVLNSAYYRITDLLYQYTNMNNTISFSTIPLYYLEPNSRISVYDENAGIYGDYVISSISIPLGNDGLMDISAYKCLQKI